MSSECDNIFRAVFREVLDYNDDDLIERGTKWGLGVFSRLDGEKNTLGADPATDKGVWFIYALAFARIVGEFGKFGFNDYLSDEVEIDLTMLGLSIDDIGGFLNEDLIQHLVGGELEEQKHVNIQDVWESLWEIKADIYKHLVGNDGKGDPLPVFRSLGALFEQAWYNDAGKMGAFSYVNNGFQY